ncbi:hypothetical protein ACLOJK_000502 [Asimina triloba]
MGNAILACISPNSSPPFKLLVWDCTPKVLLTAGKSLACFNPTSNSPVKLFFWDGTTKLLKGKQLAGELMFQFPDKIICHADSFFIGRPIQPLSIDDRLEKGQTYFVLPVEPFAGQVLSTTSLAALSRSPKRGPPISPCNQPFQYIKGSNGRMTIKVCPEFMMRLIRGESEEGCDSSPSNSSKSELCSTPELQKQYKLLVGSRLQVWSPKLQTIEECRKVGASPSRLLRLEWRPRKI